MNRRYAVAAVALASLVLPAAAAADTKLADLPGATPVRAHGDVVVWSAYDFAAGEHALLARRGTESTAIARTPFQTRFDVGPDRRGDPVVLYSRCERLRRDCALFRRRADAGAPAVHVRGGDAPGADEHDPAIWGSWFAFARTARGRTTVYARRFDWPRSRPSRRIAGALPTRRCYADGGCANLSRQTVESLELFGSRVAVVSRFSGPLGGGVSQTVLRLASLSTGAGREIAFIVTGLSGQSLIGPSFESGALGWHLSCFGDPCGSGGRAGPWRYRLASGTYQRASDSRPASGFALTSGGRAYEARSTTRSRCLEAPDEPGPAPPCELVETDPIPWVAARRPR